MNNAQFPWNLFKQKDNFDFNHRTSTEILNKFSFQKKWIRLVYTLEMDTSCPFLCQVVKMNNVQFPWTINIKYNNTYSDDHEHLTIFYTHFFREYPMRTHPKNTQRISANPFFMRRSLTSLGHKNRSQK